MNKIKELIADAIRGTEFYGHTYIVGGYVRDLIMGRESNDLDIVVDLDQGGKKLAQLLYQKGLSKKPILYERFGTSYVEVNGYKLEFVMTRKESYADLSRKPDVTKATLKEDIYRRDFTVNTLLMEITSGKIIDITGLGRKDIEMGLIRSTSDPEIIFGEDPLRILRAIRFAVQLDFRIEKKTQAGIIKNHAKLRSISWERRRDELSKMLITSAPVKAVNLLFQYNLINDLIPELIGTKELEQNEYHDKNVLDHCLDVMRRTETDLSIRLAALLHDIGKQYTRSKDEKGYHFYGHAEKSSEVAVKILRRLKYPKSLRQSVSSLISHHMRLKQAGEKGEKISDKSLRKLIREMGSELGKLLDLVQADNISHASGKQKKYQIPGLRKRIRDLTKEIDKKIVPVNGNDIKKLFKIEAGELVGNYLKKAENIWFENPGLNKQEILSKLVLEEDKMEKESKVTKITREGVKKAYDLGEDLINALARITKEIISTAKDEDLSSKEKVHKLAKEAFEGAKEGAKHAQPGAEEFLKKAGKTIVENIKIAAPKVAHFAQDALKGVYEGAKDVYGDKHPQKPTTEEKESEDK